MRAPLRLTLEDFREAVGWRWESVGDRLVSLGRRINGAPSTLQVFDVGYRAGWRNGSDGTNPPEPERRDEPSNVIHMGRKRSA